jgi:hypothetical protein
MPSTRKPQERAEILDELLAHGKWTGKELLARVNDKLQDLDGEAIDMRTLRRDFEYLETKRAPLHRPVAGDMLIITRKNSLSRIFRLMVMS